MKIDLLPEKGTHIHTGLVIGHDSEAAQEVKDKFAQKYLRSDGGSGIGAQITLGQDLLSISTDASGKTRIVATAEVSVGFLRQSDAVTIGQRPVYTVHVIETERYWDSYYGDWRYRTSDYYRNFYDYNDAANYAYWKNLENDYYHSTSASNPYLQYERVDDEEAASRGSLRVGGAVGVEHRFDNGIAVRGDALGGVDVVRKNAPYVGGRISVSGTSSQGGLGGFLQVDTVVGGALSGDTRTSIGVTGNF